MPLPPDISTTVREKPTVSDGILVVDKPPGLSSARVVAQIKRILGVKKVGHAGTLDPFATGVLVCPIGQATRLSRFLLNGRKTYAAVMRLGIATDSQDYTGAVTDERPTAHLTDVQIRQAAAAFTGPIMQVPPAFSALKHQGTPLYKLARRGTPVEKPPRPVTIYHLGIEHVDPPWVHFELTCSAGTYVRTICADWGTALGCGGHLHKLRRTAASGFDLTEAVPMEPEPDAAWLASRLVPMARTLRAMPMIQVDTDLADHIRFGRPLFRTDLPDTLSLDDDGRCQVHDDQHRLAAVIQQKKSEDRYTYCCVFQK